jgi:phosphatidylserine/phosphatidylglycerophosphate/cardiolipin synthase-like enzyme
MVDKKFLKNEGSGATIFKGMKGIETRLIDFGSGVQHSKFFIIDGGDAYLGSANFDWRALKHIHETGVRTDDAHVVTSLRNVFEYDWDRSEPADPALRKATAAKAPRIAPSKAIGFAVSPNKPIVARGMENTLDSLLDLIKKAKTSVQIQTMDYTTSVFGKRGAEWLDLQKALLDRAKDIRVELLVDQSKASQPGIRDLVKGGVEVRAVSLPEYSGGKIPFARLIHSKFLIADETKFWLGTDNFGQSYFTKSRGVGIVTDQKKTTEQLSAVFQKVWESEYAHPVR